MGELSPSHWAVVALVFIVLFGAKRLPDAARGLGRSLRILKAEIGADDSVPAAPTSPTYTAPTYTAPTYSAPAVTATPAAPQAPVSTEQPPTHPV